MDRRLRAATAPVDGPAAPRQASLSPDRRETCSSAPAPARSRAGPDDAQNRCFPTNHAVQNGLMTGGSSTGFSTSCARASPGRICPANTAHQPRSATASTGGLARGTGTGSWKRWPMRTMWTRLWPMALPCAFIIRQPRSKKRPASLHGPVTGRVNHQNTCACQSGRPADPVRADARSGSRRALLQAPAGRPATRPACAG